MKSKKPGALTLIVGAPASPSSKGAEPAPEHDDELGLAAAQQFMKSIAAGNAQGVWESFKAMKEACYSEEM